MDTEISVDTSSDGRPLYTKSWLLLAIGCLTALATIDLARAKTNQLVPIICMSIGAGAMFFITSRSQRYERTWRHYEAYAVGAIRFTDIDDIMRIANRDAMRGSCSLTLTNGHTMHGVSGFTGDHFAVDPETMMICVKYDVRRVGGVARNVDFTIAPPPIPDTTE